MPETESTQAAEHGERTFVVHNLGAMTTKQLSDYWVSCRLCPPGDSRAAGDFLESLWGETRASLGWAPSWQLAMAFADAHASLHADRACPTCRHVPDGAVSPEDTHAVMRARA